MGITILHRAATWLAVDKPAGIPTQAPAEHPSVESILRDQVSQTDGSDRPGYLAMPHRLDVPVSGVLLVALTKKSARLLGQQFESRKVSKTYHAVVPGDARAIETRWDDLICKVFDQPRVELVSAATTTDLAPPGRTAQTIVQRVDYDAEHHQSRLVLRPITGRMHQLRIGAASRGFPILGDLVYGSGEPVTVEQIHLRSVAIELHSPENGSRVCVDAPPLPWPVVDG